MATPTVGGFFVDAAAQAELTWLLNTPGNALSGWPTTYLSLHNAEPTVLPDPSTEFAGNQYARQPVTWVAYGTRGYRNAAAVTWDYLPDDTVRWYGVWDAPQGLGLVAHFLFAIPRWTSSSNSAIAEQDVTTTNSLTIPEYDLVIEL